jgi:hypothetical protein
LETAGLPACGGRTVENPGDRSGAEAAGHQRVLVSGVAPNLDLSPNGERICYSKADGLHVMAPDGAGDRLLTKTQYSVFGFSKDGSKIHAIRRGANRVEEANLLRVKMDRGESFSTAAAPPSRAAGRKILPESRYRCGWWTP